MKKEAAKLLKSEEKVAQKETAKLEKIAQKEAAKLLKYEEKIAQKEETQAKSVLPKLVERF